MNCTNCTDWNLKSAGRMAREGFGNCAHLPRYQFVAQGCAKLKQADEKTVANRIKWLTANGPEGKQ